jgi:hypothetical protein
VTGQDVIQIRFAKKDCQACLVRTACTRAKTEPRTLTVRTQGYHEVLQAARQRQRTDEFKEHNMRHGPALKVRFPRACVRSICVDHATLAWRKRIFSTS